MDDGDKATLLRQFVGFLSGDVPELHNVEVPRLGESVERFLAPPAPVTVTAGKFDYYKDGDGIWCWLNHNGLEYTVIEDARLVFDRIAADAERIAELEKELEHERRLHGITASERNEWAQHCRTAERERDEARREVEALQERLAAVAPSPKASGETEDSPTPPVAPAPDAPIPHGATVHDGRTAWRHYNDEPDGAWWGKVAPNGLSLITTDVGDHHYRALSALWRATQPRVLTAGEVEALALIAFPNDRETWWIREVGVPRIRAALAHLGMRWEEAKDA